MTQKRESQDRNKYLNIKSDKNQGTKHSGNQGHNEKTKPMNSWYKGRKRKPSQRPTNIFNKTIHFSNLRKRCLSRYKNHAKHQINKNRKETPHNTK